MKRKKRFLASTLLDQSFHVKQVFEMWYLLHDKQSYDKIQQYLDQMPTQFNRPSSGIQRQPLNLMYNGIDSSCQEYYANMKVLHRKFKRDKDVAISEINDKYCHPSQLKTYCHMKKPHFTAQSIAKQGVMEDETDKTNDFKNKRKVKETPSRKGKMLNALPEEMMASTDSFAIKTQDPADTNAVVTEPLTTKDIYKQLDDTKKKTFNKYYRWKYSLYNENNVKPATEDQLVFIHDDEYTNCCIKRKQDQAYGAITHNRPQSRLQSAKSKTNLQLQCSNKNRASHKNLGIPKSNLPPASNKQLNSKMNLIDVAIVKGYDDISDANHQIYNSGNSQTMPKMIKNSAFTEYVKHTEQQVMSMQMSKRDKSSNSKYNENHQDVITHKSQDRPIEQSIQAQEEQYVSSKTRNYLPQTNPLSAHPNRSARNLAKKGTNSKSKPQQLSSSVDPVGPSISSIPTVVKSSKLQKYEYKNGVLQKELVGLTKQQQKETLYKNGGNGFQFESSSQLTRDSGLDIMLLDEGRGGTFVQEKSCTQRQTHRQKTEGVQRTSVYKQAEGVVLEESTRLQSAAQPPSTKMSLSKQNHGQSRRNADFKQKFIRQTVYTVAGVDSQKLKDYEKSLFQQTINSAGPGLIARKNHEQDLLNKHSNTNSRLNLMEEPTPEEFGLKINSARRQLRPKDRYQRAPLPHSDKLVFPVVKGGEPSGQQSQRDAIIEQDLNSRVSIQQFEITEEYIARKGQQLSYGPSSNVRTKKQHVGNSQAIIIEKLRQSITNGSITEYADAKSLSHVTPNEVFKQRSSNQRIGSRLYDSTECTDEPANKKSGHRCHDLSTKDDSHQQRQSSTSELSKTKIRNELLSVKQTSSIPQDFTPNEQFEAKANYQGLGRILLEQADSDGMVPAARIGTGQQNVFMRSVNSKPPINHKPNGHSVTQQQLNEYMNRSHHCPIGQVQSLGAKPFVDSISSQLQRKLIVQSQSFQSQQQRAVQQQGFEGIESQIKLQQRPQVSSKFSSGGLEHLSRARKSGVELVNKTKLKDAKTPGSSWISTRNQQHHANTSANVRYNLQQHPSASAGTRQQNPRPVNYSQQNQRYSNLVISNQQMQQ